MVTFYFCKVVHLPEPTYRGNPVISKAGFSLRRPRETAKEWVSDKRGHPPWNIKGAGGRMNAGAGTSRLGERGGGSPHLLSEARDEAGLRSWEEE